MLNFLDSQLPHLKVSANNMLFITIQQILIIFLKFIFQA